MLGPTRSSTRRRPSALLAGAATAIVTVACGGAGLPTSTPTLGSALRSGHGCDLRDVSLELLGPPSPAPKLNYRAGTLTHLVGRIRSDASVTWTPVRTALSAGDARELDRLACQLATSPAATSRSGAAAMSGGQFMLTVTTGAGTVDRPGEINDVDATPLAATLVSTADRYFATDVLDFSPTGGNYGP